MYNNTIILDDYMLKHDGPNSKELAVHWPIFEFCKLCLYINDWHMSWRLRPKCPNNADHDWLPVCYHHPPQNYPDIVQRVKIRQHVVRRQMALF